MMAGNLINALARLMAAGLMLGLLSPAAHAQLPEGNLPVKLQGIYTEFSTLYYVGGKKQTGATPDFKPAGSGGVEVGSAGLLGISPTQVVNVAGISGCITFTPAKKPATTETNSQGMVTGGLSTDTGEFLISTGTYTAHIDGAGLRVILDMTGTVLVKGPIPVPVAVKSASDKKVQLVHASLNVLLRKTTIKK